MLRISVVPLLVVAFLHMSGCKAEQTPTDVMEYRSIDTTFESRGVAVPATLVLPSGGTGEVYPLVVMAHGHGGSRQEGGGYERVAEAFAERGLASIRMDFPGCGDSVESFAENNLSNMLLDLQAARQYAEAQGGIDASRVGLLGFSMGGRLVALLSEIDPSYRAMVTWAPSVADGAEREIASEFGGPEGYYRVKQQAADNGSVVHTTRWGTQLELGLRWFTDMEETFPQAALAKFTGPLLVIYGDLDESVPPVISAAAASSATSSSEVVSLVIPGARHGLGFYTNRPEVADQVVNATADFLAERL
jgi:dienelactone hydrolase